MLDKSKDFQSIKNIPNASMINEVPLNRYTEPETYDDIEFDRMTELAALFCNTQFAAISLAMENKLICKSAYGDFDLISLEEISFCKHAILNDTLFEVEDSMTDILFKDNPIVNGQPFIRFYAGLPLTDSNGFALGTLCVMDRSPKKLTDQQRSVLTILGKEIVSKIVLKKERNEKRHFEELFHRSIDLVCLAGIDGFFKKVNPAFSRTLGWTDKELTEQPFLFFVHPDDKEKTLKEMSKLSKGILTINFTNRYFTKDGTYKVLNWVAAPDVISGIIYAIAHDMTEIKEFQEKIIAGEKKFRELFENSPDAIFLEDVNGYIIDANPAAANLQGLSPEKLIGKNIKELTPGDKSLKVFNDYKSLFSGAVKTIESFVWSDAKGEIPVEITGKKILIENKPGLLLHVRDISERKKIEYERQRSIIEREALKEEQNRINNKIKDDERNRIAMEMHDDLGTGLSSISILGNVIKKSSHDPVSVEMNIDKVLASSKNLQENISSIIWAMNPKNDTIENLIAYINSFSSDFLSNSSIGYKIHFPENIPDALVGGKIRRNIYLVIKESLNNITKHGDASEVLIKIILDENFLIISIKDNGKGFDTDKTFRFGNGINNMKKRMENIDGDFQINSAPRKGTSIFIKVKYQ